MIDISKKEGLHASWYWFVYAPWFWSYRRRQLMHRINLLLCWMQGMEERIQAGLQRITVKRILP